VQRGLVNRRSVEDGGAVAVVGQAETIEPRGPAFVEMAIDLDLVVSQATMSVLAMRRRIQTSDI